MARATLSDDELSSAAREVMEYELKLFDAFGDFPDHKFRDEIEEKMKNLCHDVEHGKIKSADYHMGFTFYAKRCITAALLIITLTGIIMPGAVLAGYQKLVEVIETVFEEYTRFEYYSNEKTFEEDSFIMLEIEDLSDEWKEVERKRTANSLKLIYENVNKQYIVIHQKIMSGDYNMIFALDTEKSEQEKLKINGEEVPVICKDDIVYFIWIHDRYYVEGQTNVSREEILTFLKQIKW